MLSRDEQAKLEALERKVEALERRRDQRLYLFAAIVIVTLIATPLAVGATGDPIREGVRNPTTGEATSETQILGRHGGFVTRQSNFLVGDGGSAVYGCRSSTANEPCISVNNLNNGRAFSFQTAGDRVGTIIGPNSNARPFTTNAQAVALGLNADETDGANVCRTDGLLTMDDDDPDETVCVRGTFTIKAKCGSSGTTNPVTQGIIELLTETGNSFVAGRAVDEEAFGSVADLVRVTAPTQTTVIEPDDTGFYAGAPDGSQLTGRVGIRVKDQSVLGAGNNGTCEFIVHALD
jgi:hypothetical protein